MPKVLMGPLYVFARNINGRPMLIHKVSSAKDNHTMCGYDLTSWSRGYLAEPLDILFCKKCKKLEETGNVIAFPNQKRKQA